MHDNDYTATRRGFQLEAFGTLLKSKDARLSLIIVSTILLAMHLVLLLGIVFAGQNYPVLVGLAMLAYGFGLRHSVDPDHLAAIDNVTRKLMQDGKRPVAVGFFFALGHSSVVLVVSGLVALSSSFIGGRLPLFKSLGALVGTSFSCLFLLLIGTINLIVLLDTIKVWRKIKSGAVAEADKSLFEHIETGGMLSRVLRPMMKLVKNSWQIYWIGLIFGLGFDTASEVALLSMTGSTSVGSIPVIAVMILPLAFTAAMSLVDTLDGVLMLGVYGWAFRNPVRKIYYNMYITGFSVVLAIGIGGFEAMQLFSLCTGYGASLAGFADKIQSANWGIYIIGVFVLGWIGSALLYRMRTIGRFEE
jgi:high-affinity nickel-transport protein